jgi:hypothetical protein
MRPRKNHRRVDLISDALPFGRLWYGEPIRQVKQLRDEHVRRKYCRKRLPSPMPNESKTPEEYVSDALDLMVKARWVKQHGRSAKGLGVEWTDRGKLAIEALGYVIEDLGPENLNPQIWWAVGTIANMKFTSPS